MAKTNLKYNMLETKFYGESFVEEKAVEELNEDEEMVKRTVIFELGCCPFPNMELP